MSIEHPFVQELRCAELVAGGTRNIGVEMTWTRNGFRTTGIQTRLSIVGCDREYQLFLA